MIDDSKIREKAYELWEQAGAQEDSPETYWHQARAVLEAEESSSDAGSGGAESGDLQSSDPQNGSLESGADTIDRPGLGTLIEDSEDKSAT
jgi:hypothetical protein